jgi:hypothetical protein
VHRIGFAHGRPVAVIYVMTTPERMRTLEAAPARASAPPQAPAARPKPLASARYGNGELRFVYASKPYALAASTLKDEKTGGPRPHPSQFEGSTHVLLTASELTDCVLVLARIDASGTEGTLTCRRSATASELVPATLDFSARP